MSEIQILRSELRAARKALARYAKRSTWVYLNGAGPAGVIYGAKILKPWHDAAEALGLASIDWSSDLQVDLKLVELERDGG